MVCEIFGRFPLSVVAKKTSDNIHVIFHYENYDCIGLFCEKRQVYYASRMSETHEEGYTLSASEDWYRAEFREFCSILSGEREGISYESLISPVYIMNAILRSVESGREEFIHKICL